MLEPLSESYKNQGKAFILSSVMVLNTIYGWNWIGMYRQKCQTLRMMRVTKEFLEREIFGEPSWAPQPPNTINQSEITLL